MMRFRSSYTVAGVLLAALSIGPLSGATAMAQTSRHAANAQYSGKKISFRYPAGWAPLPVAEAKNLGGSFVSAAQGFKIDDIGGAATRVKKGGAIIVVLKALFSKKVQGQVHGHHGAFMTGFVNGLTKTKGLKVLGKRSSKLGGQASQTVDVVSTSKTSSSQQEYSVAISGDEKSIYLALYLTTPAKLWGQYSSAFSSIANSIKFR